MKILYNLFLLSIMLLCYNQTKISSLSQIALKTEEPEPISLEGAIASQSSTYNNNNDFSASNALKDDDSFQHTKEGVGKGQWWKVVLAKFYKIEKIRIQNRKGCCGDRLTGAKVLISNKPVYTFPQTKQGEWYEIKLNQIVGNEVKIITSTNQPLHFSRIQIFGKETKKPKSDPHPYNEKITWKGAKASQSSTYNDSNDFAASNALIDDDSFQHTKAGKWQYWKVVFPEEYKIQMCRIRNRKRWGGERLSGAKVYLSGKLVYTFPKTTEGQTYQFETDLPAWEIVIANSTNEPLTISYIECFGDEG